MTLDARMQLQRGTLRLDLTLRASPGQVLALLGPNGAGKTTALRVLAGLAPIDAGRVTIAGTVVDDPSARTFVPPEHRDVGVVFQDYSLFPHLTARDNVAFGLRARGATVATARRLAHEWLDRFDVGEVALARPAKLSGGQAQRVALARALVTDPDLLVLDEPLAALDAGSRGEVRRDLRRHLGAFEGVTVLVTHDPVDALALASDVVILETGTVTQAGPIGDVTARPRSRYVAELIGVNLLRGTAHGTTVALDDGGVLTIADPAEGPVFALVRPPAVALHVVEPEGSPRNHWPGRVAGFELVGDRVRVRVRLDGNRPLVAEVTPSAVAELDLHEGRHVWAAVKATELAVYPA